MNDRNISALVQVLRDAAGMISGPSMHSISSSVAVLPVPGLLAGARGLVIAPRERSRHVHGWLLSTTQVHYV